LILPARFTRAANKERGLSCTHWRPRADDRSAARSFTPDEADDDCAASRDELNGEGEIVFAPCGIAIQAAVRPLR